jgi:outer membrane protein assembly factor BamB
MNYISKILTVLLLTSLTYNCGVRPQQEEYYPLDADMSWEYNVTFKLPPIYGGDIYTVMEVVNLPKRKFQKGEAVPRKYTLKATKDLMGTTFFEFIGIDNEGTFIYAKQYASDPEPSILEYRNYFIKHPLKVGDRWQCNHESYQSKSSLISKGTITVPVGNFDNCLKIKEEGVRNFNVKEDTFWLLFMLGRGGPAKIRFESTYWYAPGVGVVKFYGSEEMLSSEPERRRGLGNIFGKMKLKVHFELTSYKRGRRQISREIPPVGKDIKSPQVTGDTDIIAFIHKHTKALQDEDLEAYMATMDEQSPSYDLTVYQARSAFDMYDVAHEFEDIEVMEKSDQYAKVKLVHTVKKLRGPAFRDVKCTEIHSLKKIGGKWKVYQSEVTDIKFLNQYQSEGRTTIRDEAVYPTTLGNDVSWAYIFGGSKRDEAYTVRQTSDRGYILVGSTESLRTGKADVLLIKTDDHGKKQWIRTFGGTYNDGAYDVRQTSDGGYILIGNKDSQGNDDVWLIKTNAQGVKQWERTFGGGKDDMGGSVWQTSDGGYILGGWTSSYGSGWMSAWVIKTDARGMKQWERVFSGSAGDMAYSAQQTSDGGYIVAGWTASYGAGQADGWLIKTDSQGRKQWERTFGGPNADSLTCLQQTPDGGYILGGLTKSYGAGKDDMWLIKTDPGGRKQWHRTFGGPDDDNVSSIQQTSDGGFILIGSTSHRRDKEDEWSTTKDMKLIKTDSHGTKQWERTFGRPNIDDDGKSVLQTPDGQYIIAGSTESYGDKEGDVMLINIQYSDDFSSDIGWTDIDKQKFSYNKGTRLILEVDPTNLTNKGKYDVNKVIKMIGHRLRCCGIQKHETRIEKFGTDKIIVELPQIERCDQAIDLCLSPVKILIVDEESDLNLHNQIVDALASGKLKEKYDQKSLNLVFNNVIPQDKQVYIELTSGGIFLLKKEPVLSLDMIQKAWRDILGPHERYIKIELNQKGLKDFQIKMPSKDLSLAVLFGKTLCFTVPAVARGKLLQLKFLGRLDFKASLLEDLLQAGALPLKLKVVSCKQLTKLDAAARLIVRQTGLADSPWPMFNQNPLHTGRSPYNGPQEPRLKWKFKTGRAILSSPCLGPDGTIYIGSDDQYIYAINPDGTEKWKFRTQGHNRSSPVVAQDGTIYAASFDGNLYALNPAGKLKWKYRTKFGIATSPVITKNGTVYIGSCDTFVYAINKEGKCEKAFKTNDFVYSSPAIGYDGTIYIGSDDKYLYALNPNGTWNWRFKTDGPMHSSPAIGIDGTIYIGISVPIHSAFQGGLYAVDPNGIQKWKFNTEVGIYASPAIGIDDTIYIGATDNNLYAITQKGKEKWRFRTNGGIYGGLAIGRDGTIYVGSDDQYLYAVNTDGSLKWKFKTNGGLRSPCIGRDSTIYVGSFDSYLYAIGCSHKSSMNTITLQCKAEGRNCQTEYSFSKGEIIDNSQVDITFYFDGDDCSQGALFGQDDSKGYLFPVGKKSWKELSILKTPPKDAQSVIGIMPLTREKEGLTFWVKTRSGEYVLARIRSVSPASYSDLLSGGVAALELEWTWTESPEGE